MVEWTSLLSGNWQYSGGLRLASLSRPFFFGGYASIVRFRW